MKVRAGLSDELFQAITPTSESVFADPVIRFAIEHCGAQVTAIYHCPGAIDLHVHTTASDGTVEPQELVRRAAVQGVKVLAITDHDTTEGLAPALAAAAQCGVTVIPGIELSADENGQGVHILGYFIDPSNRQLQLELNTLRLSRIERARAMVEKLGDLGFPIAWSQVAQTRHDAIGRAHIARALVEAGHVGSVEEAFAKLIGKHAPGYIKRQHLLSPEGAIHLILDAGGVPVLAHPLSPNELGQLSWTIPMSNLLSYVRAGLAGLEAYYTGYSPELSQKLVNLARVLGLIVTGGSDFHGETKPGNHLGGIVIPDSCVEDLWVLHSTRRQQALWFMKPSVLLSKGNAREGCCPPAAQGGGEHGCEYEHVGKETAASIGDCQGRNSNL
jgi:predicted metal-dependent phosphoesterase TrpH